MQQEHYVTSQPLPPDGLAPPDEGKDHKDHFLKMMLFQPSGVVAYQPHPKSSIRGPRRFNALHQSKLTPNLGYYLPDAVDTKLHADSPAIDVMTDLRRIAAITIGPSAFIEEASQTMIAHRVGALFVAEGHRLLGIVTAADILGEKPVQLTQQRGIHHEEVLIRDIMTPAERLDVIDMTELLHAKVGDVVETLKRDGRQHALVVDETSAAHQMVVGIFSLTQIARQMGITLIAPDIARTFADIEAAIVR
ncbi:MAG: CBS domain-containing protein [Proteobacteria bacterium]|nr:CBS domain-containing protein [Pseudomonadota bacterium]